jgi:energy-coupling factor transporter ATP-binding protein EcfA2
MSMLNIRLRSLGFDRGSPFLRKVCFSLSKGDILFVAGATGSGKSSLLKVLSGLIPDMVPANFSGTLEFAGENAPASVLQSASSLSFQEAEQQFLLSSVEDELGFFLPPADEEHMRAIIKRLKLTDLLQRSLRDLSSGQRKLVSVATTLCANRCIRILDEPTAHLDNATRQRVLDAIVGDRRRCLTVIASHDHAISTICSHFLLISDGTASFFRDRQRILKLYSSRNHSRLERKAPVSSGRCITLQDVSYRYPSGIVALKRFSLTVARGEKIAIIGENGSGKSTVLDIIMHRIRQNSGTVISNPRDIGFVMQEPEKQLFAGTVSDELVFGIPGGIFLSQIKEQLSGIGLWEKRSEHPFFLSRGQKQLLLIRSVMLRGPDVVIIDEPFTGLDPVSVRVLSHMIREYPSTVILTGHDDVDFTGIVDRVARMEDIQS